jgi:hypothetical protein
MENRMNPLKRLSDRGQSAWLDFVSREFLETRRFRSREHEAFADRMLSAMRKGFGGHVEPPHRT